MPVFEVGNRVKIKDTYYRPFMIGRIGTVTSIKKNGSIGIEFDDDIAPIKHLLGKRGYHTWFGTYDLDFVEVCDAI